MLPNKPSKKGDCEVRKEHTDLNVYLMYGTIWMCQECMDGEMDLIEKNKAVRELALEAAKSQKPIELVTEIYNNKTPAISEMRAKIEQDDSVPQDKKEYAFALMCQEKRKELQTVIFEKRNELRELDNEEKAWQVNGQESVGRLRVELRAEFHELDVRYQPEPVKKPKSKETVIKDKKAFKIDVAKAAAEKYGVDLVMLQMMMQKKLYKTHEEAAQALARLKGN